MRVHTIQCKKRYIFQCCIKSGTHVRTYVHMGVHYSGYFSGVVKVSWIWKILRVYVIIFRGYVYVCINGRGSLHLQ